MSTSQGNRQDLLGNSYVNLNDGFGNALTSTNSALDVNIKSQVTAPITGSTLTQVAQSATSVNLLVTNSNRKGFVVENNATSMAKLTLGATSSLTAFTRTIQPNTGYELGINYMGPISMIWAATGTGFAQVTEL